MFQRYQTFPNWEDGFLTAVVAIYVVLAGAGVVMAWLNRRRD